MNYLSWMTTFLLIGLTVQRSLPTDEDNDSLDFLSEDRELPAKDSELSEEEDYLKLPPRLEELLGKRKRKWATNALPEKESG